MRNIQQLILLIISMTFFNVDAQDKTDVEIPDRACRVLKERQPIADFGNGQFRNPVLSGHFHDPTVVRAGKDYYMTHLEFQGSLIWHSRDLVNWQPICRPLKKSVGGWFWATDLIYHDGLFYLYIPVMLPDTSALHFTNVVLTAKDPAGPWSDPVDLKVDGFDPGHIADQDGNRYLYFNNGWVSRLTKDGLATIGERGKVYDGWKYPNDWVLECKCLESPKLFYREGYYYMLSAQGGTGGPSTSHMIIVARAESPMGPWENSPLNPMLRTKDHSEGYWTQGHGTMLDDTEGNWWVVYHAYQNGKRPLGKNTVLLPVEWTKDGWPVIPEGIQADDILTKPAGEDIGHGMPLSDDFTSEQMGLQWDWLDEGDMAEFVKTGNGALTMQSQGDDVATSTRITCLPMNLSFEAEVEVEVAGDEAIGGIGFLFGGKVAKAAALKGTSVQLTHAFGIFTGIKTMTDVKKRHVWLRIRNNLGDASFQYSTDGKKWIQFAKSCEISSFKSGRISLFAQGEGEVVFKNFKYLGLDK